MKQLEINNARKALKLECNLDEDNFAFQSFQKCQVTFYANTIV